MSHEVETMAWVSDQQKPWWVDTPWQGLAVDVMVNSDITSQEMLKAAGLDWEVQRRELFTLGNDGRQLAIPGRRALVRSTDEKVLGTCGQDWRPVQNADILAFFGKYADAGGMRLETAGSLKGGTIVWALLNLNHGFTVGSKNDRVKGYLMMSTSHKPGVATVLRTTAIRVECANTFAMAESAGGVNYRQSHTKEFDFSRAHEVAEQAHENLAECARRANTLATLKLSTADSVQLLSKFFLESQLTPDEAGVLDNYADTKVEEVMYSVNHAPGAVAGTAWGLLNGLTHWCDHMTGRSAATRLFRSWMGDNAKLKLDVEQELFEMAS